MAANSNEVGAIKDAKSYACATIVATALAVIFFVTAYVYVITRVIAGVMTMFGRGAAAGTPPTGMMAAFASHPLAIALILLFGLIELIIGVYAIIKIRSSFKNLSKNDGRFMTPYNFINYFVIAIVVGIILLILHAATMITGLAVLAIILMIIGFILLALGIALGLWRLGSRYDNAVLKIGSVLALFSVLPGIIFVYLGLGEILSSKKSGKK